LNKTPVAFFIVVDKGYFERGCQVGCFNLKSLGSLTHKENGQILKYPFFKFSITFASPVNLVLRFYLGIKPSGPF
jgi:hypothetical protein